MAARRDDERRGGGGSFSNSKGNDASQARYEAQARAAAAAQAAARAAAAGAGNPGALAGSDGAAADPYVDAGGGGSYSSDGGGGASTMAAAAPIVARPDLNSYISGNYLVNAATDEGKRTLSDFDAETTRGEGSVRADQGVRLGNLQTQLNQAGVDNSESMASRGLLRSGLTFQNQDKINAEGATQRQSIGDLLTNFMSGRTSARVSAEQDVRAAQNEARQKAIDQYIATYGAV